MKQKDIFFFHSLSPSGRVLNASTPIFLHRPSLFRSRAVRQPVKTNSEADSQFNMLIQKEVISLKFYEKPWEINGMN